MDQARTLARKSGGLEGNIPGEDNVGAVKGHLPLRDGGTADGDEGYRGPAADDAAYRGDRGGPGRGHRGGQGAAREALRRRGLDPRRDRRGARGERRGVRPLVRPEGRRVSR